MKNPTLWIVIGGIALFVLGLFRGMLLPFGSNYPVCGYGFANGYGLMGYRGFMPRMGGSGMFGFPGMLLMWLIPLGILTLIIGGVIWLVRTLTQRTV